MIGTFGAITVKKDGRRLYLTKDPSTGALSWSKTAPTTAQSWVQTEFPGAKYLPKMKQSARQQMEQLDGRRFVQFVKRLNVSCVILCDFVIFVNLSNLSVI